MITVAKLVAEIGAEMTPLLQAIPVAKAKLQEVAKATTDAGDKAKKDFADSWTSAGRSVSSAVGSIVSSAKKVVSSIGEMGDQATHAGFAISLAFSAPIVNLVKTGLEFDDLRKKSNIAFTSMLHDAALAKKMVAGIEDLSATTPFQPGPLIEYAQQLKAMGAQAGDIIPDLKAVTDAVTQMGKGETAVGRVTYAIGEMLSLGKIGERQLRMFSIDAGVDAHQILADWMHKSKEEASQIIERGGLTGDNATNAVQALVAGLEKHAPDAAKKGMETLTGAMSNLKQFATQTLGDLLTPMYKNVVDTLNSSQKALGDFRSMIQNLGKVNPEVLVKIGNAMMAISIAGPAVLGVGAALKAVAILASPIGLIAGAFASLAYYMLSNKSQTAALLTSFSSLGPVVVDLGVQLGKLATSVGGVLFTALSNLVPIMGTALKVLGGLLTAFNSMPDSLKTAIVWVGLFGIALKGVQASGVLSIGGIAASLTTKLVPALISAIGFWNQWSQAFGVGNTLVTMAQTFATAVRTSVLGAWTSVGTYITGTLAPSIAAMALSLTGLIAIAATAAYLGKVVYDAKQAEIQAMNDEENRLGNNYHPALQKLMPQYRQLQKQYDATDDSSQKVSIKAQMDDIMNQIKRSLIGDTTGNSALRLPQAGSKIGEEIVKHISLGIQTPAGQASCAYFASEVLKSAGVKISTTGSAGELQKKLVALGAVAHPGLEAKAGDVLIFHGQQYGAIKDSQGMGYHAAIAQGFGRYAQSSNGVNSFRNLSAKDAPFVTAYTLPDAAKKGGAGAYKDNGDAEKAKELLDQYNKLKDQHLEAIALFGKEGEAAKMRYELEHGELAALSPTQKGYLIGLASQEDRLTSAKEAADKYAKAKEELDAQSLEFVKAVSLGADATETQSLAWDFAHKSLSGLNDEQKKDTQNRQQTVLALSRQKEAMQAVNALTLQQSLLAIRLRDEHKADLIDAVGGLAKWQQMTPQEQGAATSKFDWIQQANLAISYSEAVQKLRTETQSLGNETEKAAISAAGGQKNWDSYSETMKGVLRTQVSVNTATASLHGLLAETQIKLADTISPVRSELDNTNISLEKILRGLTDAGKSDSGVTGMVGQIRDLASQADSLHANKIWQDLNDASKSKSMGPLVEAQRQWLDTNKQNAETIGRIQGPFAQMAYVTAGMAKSAKEFKENLVEAGKAKVADMLGSADKVLAELTTKDPFQRWLISIEEVDKQTGQLRLPPGMDEDKLREIFDKQEQAKGLQKYNDILGSVLKQAQDLVAADPFQVWLNQFKEFDAATGQFKLPAGLDPAKLKDLFNLKQSLDLVKQFTDGIAGLFDQTITDIRDKGFKGLFTSIWKGFDDLLFKMALSYLQSQFMQLVSRGFGISGNRPMSESTGIFGSILGIIPSLFGLGSGGGSSNSTAGAVALPAVTRMAKGGRAMMNTPYWVGDGGEPELFVPDSSGTIVPKSQVDQSEGGVHYHFNYTIQTNDPEKFRGVQARTMAEAKAVADQHQRRTR